MSLDNIIIVIGPNLMWNPENDDEHCEIGSIKGTLATLIEETDYLFEHMDRHFDFNYDEH